MKINYNQYRILFITSKLLENSALFKNEQCQIFQILNYKNTREDNIDYKNPNYFHLMIMLEANESSLDFYSQYYLL